MSHEKITFQQITLCLFYTILFFKLLIKLTEIASKFKVKI